MKKIIAVAALAALAACSQAETPAPEATEEAAAAPAAAEVMAADGKAAYGKFQVTTEDGKKYTTDVKPDGTYAIADADGKVTETGKWVQNSPAEYCETSDEPGSKQICFDEKVENGVYTSYNPVTKTTSTVVRVES